MTENAASKTPDEKAKELRLALVCYGGVSLAVYMHGVSREILNLVRASKAVRERTSPSKTQKTTTDVYVDLLSALAPSVKLRVIVDVIAGASAGGINGIMLSRALAYDLPLDSHRKMWLELADVTELLDPSGRARVWSKPFMRPMLGFLNWWQSKTLSQVASRAARSLEVRQKISLLTRSRWFEPPFSGPRMTEMMVDGLRSMGPDAASKGSLLPPGHPLELFVTGTDFWGHRQLLTLHDPPVIVEREHRHIFAFRHVGQTQQADRTHMDEAGLPGLAFAARATSCFPGAFPPLQLGELDRVLAEKKLSWPEREAFVQAQFRGHLLEGEDIEEASFIDGSVLMNKPLALAIRAVQDRSASREVDRRIVYIDPNPDKRAMQNTGPPGFFSTLKGALSDIPRNQPIRDDLEWLNDFNARADNLRQIIAALTPKVIAMVSQIRSGRWWGRALTADRLKLAREKAHAMAAENAGYTYGGYARLKVLTVLEHVAGALSEARVSASESAIHTTLDAWAHKTDVLPIADAALDAINGERSSWVTFLRSYDVTFRIRRFRFMLRRVNEMYGQLPASGHAENRDWLNRAKSCLYDATHQFEAASHLTRDNDAFLGLNERLDEHMSDAVDKALEAVADQFNLVTLDNAFDHVFVELYNDAPDRGIADKLLDSYLGFTFFDVATLPLTQWRDLYELNEVRVDRISANDANSLDRGGAGQLLKGADMGNFGAFFSRAYRENDYLWGRLTGAERLIDIVVSAAPGSLSETDIHNLKKTVFEAVLSEEAPHLQHIPEIFKDIRKRVAAMA